MFFSTCSTISRHCRQRQLFPGVLLLSWPGAWAGNRASHWVMVMPETQSLGQKLQMSLRWHSKSHLSICPNSQSKQQSESMSTPVRIELEDKLKSLVAVWCYCCLGRSNCWTVWFGSFKIAQVGPARLGRSRRLWLVRSTKITKLHIEPAPWICKLENRWDLHKMWSHAPFSISIKCFRALNPACCIPFSRVL